MHFSSLKPVRNRGIINRKRGSGILQWGDRWALFRNSKPWNEKMTCTKTLHQLRRWMLLPCSVVASQSAKESLSVSWTELRAKRGCPDVSETPSRIWPLLVATSTVLQLGMNPSRCRARHVTKSSCRISELRHSLLWESCSLGTAFRVAENTSSPSPRSFFLLTSTSCNSCLLEAASCHFHSVGKLLKKSSIRAGQKSFPQLAWQFTHYCRDTKSSYRWAYVIQSACCQLSPCILQAEQGTVLTPPPCLQLSGNSSLSELINMVHICSIAPRGISIFRTVLCHTGISYCTVSVLK